MGFISSSQQGLLAGVLNTFLLQPFDVVKTLQQQNHTGFRETVRQQFKENKFGFYRGVVPSLYRNSIGYAMYFGLIKEYKSLLGNGFINNLSTGVLARFSCGIALAPLTFLKARFESTTYNYTSLKSAIHIVYTKEGIKTFYTAVSATVFRDILYSGLYFGLYEYLKQDYSIYTSASSSAIISLLLTHPLDSIKTKMQISPNLFPSFLHTYRALSIKMMYSGFIPRGFRRVAQALVAWSLFEQIK